MNHANNFAESHPTRQTGVKQAYGFLRRKLSLHRQTVFTVLLLLLVFAPLCTFDFVSWDDDRHVYHNPYLNPPSTANLALFWKTPHQFLYIPVTYTIWTLCTIISRQLPARDGLLNPLPFHLLSLLVHAGSCLVLAMILKRLLKRHLQDEVPYRQHKAETPCIHWAAGCGTILFAIHPIQVETIAWVSETKGVLCGFFSMLGLLAYLRFAGKPTKGPAATAFRTDLLLPYRDMDYLVATACYILALLSKPVAVALAPMVLVVDVFLLRRSFPRSLAALLPWLVLIVPIAWITRAQQPTRSLIPAMSLMQRSIVAMGTTGFYWMKLFLPFPLGPDYGLTPSRMLDHIGTYILPFLLWTLSVLLCARKKETMLLACLLLFVAGFAPVSGWIPFGFQNISTVADRYMYPSMFAAALGTSYLVLRFLPEKGPYVFCAVLIVLGWKTSSQLQIWKNSITLYEHALRMHPDSAPMNNNYGMILTAQGKLEEAIVHYRRALRTNPQHYRAYNNLGIALAKQAHDESAADAFLHAIEIAPNFPDAHNNLGIVYKRLGRYEDAALHYQKAIHLDPRRPEAWNNLGRTYEVMDRIDDALFCYQRALQLHPGYHQAAQNRRALVQQQHQRKTVNPD